VKDKAKEYVSKLDKAKKDKKLGEEAYLLAQKQINLTKGWIKQKNLQKIKQDINKTFIKENAEREKEGKNKIFLKNNQMQQLIKAKAQEQRNEHDTKRFLKKKKHRESVQNKKKVKIL
jgi:hypothetical protein